MPIDSGNLALKGLDELFSTEEKRQEEQSEQVQQIPIDELHPFTNHPFKVVDDEAMTRTVESIAQFGVLAPLIARPRPDGDGYEIISGHRRQFAAKMAGLETLPVIVRDMDDDAATILMVDSNLQREHISPSERAFAYKMKLDALKNQGARSDLTSRQVVGKLEAADVIGKTTDESGRQVQRYVRLTNLISELLNMVDEKMISFNPAVELSYLSPEQQQEMIKAMDDTQNAPSVSQAKRIKELAQKGQFTSDAVVAIMGEEKKGELDTVTIKNDILRKYFPRSYTPRQMSMMKIKKFGALLVSAVLCIGMAAPAFAYEGDTTPVEEPVLPEIVEEEDAVTITDEETGALTPEGNLTLVDDYHTNYSDGSGQQFITMVSKSGATFYLVIDRNAKGQQTVHFMNLVDEADLLALMEEEAAEAYNAEKEAAKQAELDKLKAEEEAKKAAEEAAASDAEQPKENKVTKYAAAFLGVVALIALVAGGGFYFFIQQKHKKQAEKEAADPDADYTEDNGNFEIPPEDDSNDEDTSEEQDVTPI